jgi:arginine/ornithine N-succinyltransferase beta subunit
MAGDGRSAFAAELYGAKHPLYVSLLCPIEGKEARHTAVGEFDDMLAEHLSVDGDDVVGCISLYHI